jgi:DUF4097 and DUF4098 domain-containing protein YvlB
MSSSVDLDVAVLRVAATSGAVDVVAEEGRSSIETDGIPAEVDGDVVTVDARDRRARVRIPEGLDVIVGTTSGRVSVEGRVGDLAVGTTSGRVTIDRAASVDVRTSSAKVIVGRAEGECRVVTRSGRVQVDHCGRADVTTASGRIVLRDVAGGAHAHCTSGRIEISMAGAHDVVAETVSGRVSISLPSGARPLVESSSSGSGAARGDHDCTVVARSASGRVTVTTR